MTVQSEEQRPPLGTMAGWVETSPNVFTKSLGGIEKVYRKISQTFVSHGREHWGLYCTCRLSLDTSSLPRGESNPAVSSALRRAWQTIRQDLPGLASIPIGLTEKQYTTAAGDAAELERWADNTLFIVEEDLGVVSCPDDLLASYPPSDLPSLHFFPATCQLTLLTSHWRMDGLGACMVMDALLARLADCIKAPTRPGLLASAPDSETDSKALRSAPADDLSCMPPSLEDACGAAQTGPGLDPALDALAHGYIADHHRNAVHAGGMTYLGDASQPPGRPARATIVLGKASTASLVATCKALRVSVTAAVHAALAEVVFNRGVDRGAERYSAVVSANMRPRLPPPLNGPEGAVATYVVGTTPVVAREDPFHVRATKLTAFYRGWWTPQFSRALRRSTELHAEALFGTANGPPRPPATPPKPPSNVLLSSLGIVERHMKGRYSAAPQGECDAAQSKTVSCGGDPAPIIRVTDFQFGVSMMTRQMILYVWTFDCRLNLSVNYNDAYHSKQSSTKFLGLVAEFLGKGLSVALDVERRH